MPPAAPTVQSLSDIVAGIQAAQAPENAQIDTEEAQNDQSGAAQTAGLNAAQTTAFGTINNDANAKGMYFSGFTPDAEAKYTSSTYLPALAKLQATIAQTRGTLEGQKATLATDANTEGLSTLADQQKALDDYNNAQTTAAATAAAAAEKDQTTLEGDEIKAAGSGSTTGAPAKTTNSVGGYEFTDKNGNPISVANYAKLTDQSVASALAGSKDKGDQAFLNDYSYLQQKVAGGMSVAAANAALNSLYSRYGATL